MGNADSNPVRNLDKRTARREYASDFIGAINNYRYHHLNDNNSNNDNTINNNINNENTNTTNDVHVYVRKRPIFNHEKDNGEFDVITSTAKNTVVIHDCKMHSDMKRMFLNNHEFIFDEVFDDKCNNNTVYNNAIAPLVKDTINNNIFSTIMVYGQTGSGKTFTMSSVYEQCCKDIFELLHEQTERFKETSRVSVSFFEIVGDSCIDLFNSSAPTQLYTGPDGCVHASPAAEPIVNDADELMALINYACSIRTTAATGVHDSSSRSHAILRIYIQKNYTNDEDVENEGVLTLVDLAGTEHKIDSLYHSADRRKETASINASLMALKDCLRNRSSGNNMSFNYRKSTLTKMLKASFFMKSAKTVVIATVSPASKDTEHSLNTLRHACLMDGQHERSDSEETRFITGGRMTTQQIGSIDLAGIGRKNFANRKAGIEKSLATSNGNETDFRTRDKSPIKEEEKSRLRRAAERRQLAAMPNAHRQVLLKARKVFNNTRQQMRMRKVIPDLVETDTIEDENIEAVDAQKTDNDPHSPMVQKDIKSKKYKEIKKLYAQVYSDVVPPALVRRQFITLMKMKGYTEEDISTYAPPSPTDIALDKVSIKRENDEPSSCMSNPSSKKDVVRRIHFADQTLSNNDRNNNSHQLTSSSSQSTVSAADIVAKEAQTREMRQINAREMRNKLERERKENILKRINNDKVKVTSVQAVKKVVSNVDIIINDLEQQLLAPDVTAAQAFAVKKSIAMHKAVKVKEQRQQEMEVRRLKREEEEQKKKEKLALEANDSNDNDDTNNAVNGNRSNTATNVYTDFSNIDRQLSYHDERNLKPGFHSSSSNSNHHHHQQQQHDISLPPRFLRADSDHQNQRHQNEDNNDYQYQQPYTNHSPHHQLLRSNTAPQPYLRSDRSSFLGHGASSAPFGNSFNDNDEHD